MADEKLTHSVKELLSAIEAWQDTPTLKEIQSLSYESLSACTAITRAANEVKDLLND